MCTFVCVRVVCIWYACMQNCEVRMYVRCLCGGCRLCGYMWCDVCGVYMVCVRLSVGDVCVVCVCVCMQCVQCGLDWCGVCTWGVCGLCVFAHMQVLVYPLVNELDICVQANTDLCFSSEGR